jgi:hypothetical protein
LDRSLGVHELIELDTEYCGPNTKLAGAFGHLLGGLLRGDTFAPTPRLLERMEIA